MSKQTKENVKLVLKSAGLTAIGLILVVLGFIAAGYLFGNL